MLVVSTVFEQAKEMLPEFLTFRGMKNAGKVVGDVYKDKFLYVVGADFFAGIFPDDFAGSIDSAVRRYYKKMEGTIFVVANFTDDIDDDRRENSTNKRVVVRVRHDQLLVNPLTHATTGESSLLTGSEVTALLDTIKAPLTMLPKILADDIVVVWLGAKKGDVVRNKVPTKVGIQDMYYYVS